jgi:protoporphyrinogen oxidase
MKHSKVLILGAGMTGLSAGWVSGLPVYESQSIPGGICSSYYVFPGQSRRIYSSPNDKEAYRFEIGGGHWIFGGDPTVLHFIRSLAPVKSYKRRSAVFFSKQGLYVPYPIQNHLGYLDKEIAKKALDEIMIAPKGNPKTMSDWLEQSFGQILTQLFFAPFHEKYTAGLWTRIAPQDAYKSPVNQSVVIQGAFDKTPPAVGYNVTYIYPKEGLNTLAGRMAERCNVNYEKKVARINLTQKEISFHNGSSAKYDNLISTLPLNRIMEIAGLETDCETDCCTSVLVLNIGAKRGSKCPSEHWLYIPDSNSGFHRVGFYSNVDVSFLPESSQKENDRVSIYVERAYRSGEKPSDEEIALYSKTVVKELQSWKFIEEAETVDPTWIDVAYTWSWPNSNWRERTLKLLEEQSVFQVGRYGRWIFQGIAESIKDGFFVGAAIGKI